MNESQIILIVEDSDDDYFATLRAFKKVNFANPIHRCHNGDQVFDYLYQRGEFAAPGRAPRPGMILLDLNLPGTDGREVLSVVKSDPRLQQIPVIILTTSYARQDIQRCYDAGADSYVQKPVDFAGFVEAIAQIKKNWLEASEMSKEAE
jgi:CheY-like chemotaxis protein